MLHQIIVKILEGFDVVAFCAALFYALIGMVVMLLITSNKRDVNSDRTPVHYSYLFLIKDNAIRILTTVLFIMVFIRFSQELLGKTITSWLGFALGLISDRLGNFLQRIAGGFRDQVSDFIDKIFPPKTK